MQYKSTLTNSVFTDIDSLQNFISTNLDLCDYSQKTPLKLICSDFGLDQYLDDAKFRYAFVQALRNVGFQSKKNQYYNSENKNVTLWTLEKEESPPWEEEKSNETQPDVIAALDYAITLLTGIKKELNRK